MRNKSGNMSIIGIDKILTELKCLGAKSNKGTKQLASYIFFQAAVNTGLKNFDIKLYMYIMKLAGTV